MISKKELSSKGNHIGFLDGLRGFLAFWVYFAHLEMASIGKEAFWGSPHRAVNGFMILSGFLMAYHWILRKDRFQSFWQQAKDFYLRRFFRIAPLYYFLLTIVIIFQRKFDQIKLAVLRVVPPAWGGEVVIATSSGFEPRSIWNILTHYSFAFGLIPKYVDANMLPDWSIGLEMQFYLLFPLLVLILAEFGPLTTTIGVFLATFAVRRFPGMFGIPDLLAIFPQPSFILFKLNLFFAGMAIAYAYLSKETTKKVLWILLSILVVVNGNIHTFIILGAMILLLFFDEDAEDLISRLGNGKLSKFFGNTSYGLYLLHLPVMYPILYYLFQQDWFMSLPLYPRFAISFVIISPLVYGLAYLAYRFIEIPGIQYGKTLSKRWLIPVSSSLPPHKDQ